MHLSLVYLNKRTNKKRTSSIFIKPPAQYLSFSNHASIFNPSPYELVTPLIHVIHINACKVPFNYSRASVKKIAPTKLISTHESVQLTPFIIPFGDLEKSKKLMLAASHFDVVSFSLGQQKLRWAGYLLIRRGKFKSFILARHRGRHLQQLRSFYTCWNN